MRVGVALSTRVRLAALKFVEDLAALFYGRRAPSSDLAEGAEATLAALGHGVYHAYTRAGRVGGTFGCLVEGLVRSHQSVPVRVY
jgi:hypothetical protein